VTSFCVSKAAALWWAKAVTPPSVRDIEQANVTLAIVFMAILVGTNPK
jgi:hypothetical protein